ncbi:hypothetical protein CR105_27075 [Massilia eurypsychrophila]|uniref:Transposase n=1 Tax=Massilia eurypsychrophila TaxID=1485217 RepID=A0A2G8T8E4_9BURK|nr:hypothetical protein CR105_27075 [Massilia eurypsychrophila]
MDTIIKPGVGPSKRGSYCRHTDEFKHVVTMQSLLPNASVPRIARKHNVNANQVCAWRKLFVAGHLAPWFTRTDQPRRQCDRTADCATLLLEPTSSPSEISLQAFLVFPQHLQALCCSEKVHCFGAHQE